MKERNSSCKKLVYSTHWKTLCVALASLFCDKDRRLYLGQTWCGHLFFKKLDVRKWDPKDSVPAQWEYTMQNLGLYHYNKNGPINLGSMISVLRLAEFSMQSSYFWGSQKEGYSAKGVIMYSLCIWEITSLKVIFPALFLWKTIISFLILSRSLIINRKL